jgi:predicted metal-dependent peptidase
MKVEEKFSKAKTLMILSEPFFASVAMGLDYVEDTSGKTKTMSTNGKNIKYNPDFVEKTPLDELSGVLAHEVLHITNLHHTRQGLRNHRKWNKAADYAINPIIIECGLKLPKDVLLDDRFRDKPAEEIYNELPDEPEDDDPDADSDPGGCGGIDPSDNKGEAEREKEEQEVREMVSQAINNAKKQGRLPGFLARHIDEALKPQVDWKEVLARFLSEAVRDDYSFRRPNMRYIHTGFFLPSLYNETVGDIIMIVDTSMSINQVLLNKFGGEMQEVVNTFGKGFTVVYVDAKVQSHEYVEPDGPVDLHPSGGGGTDFKPGFEWIDAHDLKPKAVVYFTDGECNSFPEIPDYPVLWATYGKREFNPPFGEVVNVIE